MDPSYLIGFSDAQTPLRHIDPVQPDNIEEIPARRSVSLEPDNDRIRIAKLEEIKADMLSYKDKVLAYINSNSFPQSEKGKLIHSILESVKYQLDSINSEIDSKLIKIEEYLHGVSGRGSKLISYYESNGLAGILPSYQDLSPNTTEEIINDITKVFRLEAIKEQKPEVNKAPNCRRLTKFAIIITSILLAMVIHQIYSSINDPILSELKNCNSMDECLEKPLLESYSWYSFIIAYRERRYIDHYKTLIKYQSEELERMRQARSNRIDLLEGYISSLLQQLIRERPSQLSVTHYAGLSKLNLEKLQIDSNVLEILSSFSFPDLVELKLSQNSLRNYYHGGYFNTLLPNLKVLDLSGNSFGYNGLENIIRYATNVEKLILNDCNLSDNIRVLYDHPLPNLRVLSLENSGINSDSIRYLCSSQLRSLTELNLSKNNLSYSVYENLSKCKLPNLITLRLSGTGMSTIKWLIHTNFPSLKVLDISNNSISSEEVGNIVQMIELKSLDLSYNNLGNAGTKILAHSQSRSLEYLGLRGNDIDDIGAKLIADANLPQLKTLDLRWNRIGAEGTAAFMKGKLKLDYLYLKDS